VEQFTACLDGLKDPRTGTSGRDDFYEIVVVPFRAALCGGESAVDVPLFAAAKDQFSQFSRLLDPGWPGAACKRFMAWFTAPLQGVVAIGGKMLRCSVDRAGGKSPLHIVSAWGYEQHLVLSPNATDATSNEITKGPKRPNKLSLKHSVSVDALNCQSKIAQQIIDRRGACVPALKAKSPRLHPDVQTFQEKPASAVVTAELLVGGDHDPTDPARRS